MTQLRRQPSTGPAWGSHLALDAIVAYVDEELSPGARRRALEHLAGCSECAGEVIAQTQARWLLRRAAAPSLPSSLLNTLRAIPTQAELPEPPAGLAVTADGQLVSVLRDPAPPRGEPTARAGRWPLGRRVRLGAGAAVTGLALVGVLVAGHLAGVPGAAAGPVSTASIGGAAYLAPNPAPNPAAGAPVGAAAVTTPAAVSAPTPTTRPPAPRSPRPAARDSRPSH